MKTIANCDDVFETLTAGPTQFGNEREGAIEEHLRDCPSCRELSDALRPACNRLHESLSADQRATLPMVLDRRDTKIRGLMEELAPSRSVMPMRRNHNWGRTLATSIAITLLLVLLLGGRPWEGSGAANPPESLTGIGFLRSLPLGDSCLKVGDASKAFAAASQLPVLGPDEPLRYDCCTKCHNNTPAGHRSVGTAVLVASCRGCHP